MISPESAPAQTNTALLDAPGATAVTDRAAGQHDLDLRVVLFSVSGGRLRVALVRGHGGHRLPRGVPQRAHGLDAEARRILREQTGRIDQYIEQLYTLGAESERRWTVMVSYLALVAADEPELDVPGCEWRWADDSPELSEADRMVLDYALLRLRAKIGYSTIAFRLLPPVFTMRELQDVYEAILGHPVDKRNFRRRVAAAAPIEATGQRRRDGSHRPAELYRYRGDRAAETYLTPPWAAGGQQE